MRTPRSPVRVHLGTSLIFILVFNNLIHFASVPAHAQKRKPIIITADQPNVWTLEQAHYLLAQMHRRNLDLKAKSLEDLDANEINGLNFDVLKTLLEVGVAYNGADRLNNQLLARDKRLNADRRPLLITRRDNLRNESLTLTRDIARLQRERERATSEADQARLDSEIDEKTAVRAAVDKEIEFVDGDLKATPAANGELTATTAEGSFDAKKPPGGALDEVFKEATGELVKNFNKAPQLNASLRLDKYVQMQYEIIAKQLTLLRDEVGVGERLLFLELPQSINVIHDKADKKWAQTWWRIAGYSAPTPTPTPLLTRVRRTVSISTSTPPSERPTQSTPTPTPTPTPRRSSLTSNITPRTVSEIRESLTLRDTSGGLRGLPRSDEYVPLGTTTFKVDYKTDPSSGRGFYSQTIEEKPDEKILKEQIISDRRVRTVDLIPRQSSLNVNDVKLKTRAGALTAVVSTLFGFGASVNYQRQREQFSQFVQQELYSSAFGKGSREFGWTFTPMPGTDRLMPGARTTYAVVIVPKEATSIRLESTGCYFPRSDYQPANFDEIKTKHWIHEEEVKKNERSSCSPIQMFDVSIPLKETPDQDAFGVNEIAYEHVEAGERIVVSVGGKYLPSQIGVLINGVSLIQSIGLAQPLILDDSRARASVLDPRYGNIADDDNRPVYGEFERVNDSELTFWFDMPKKFTGTPIITLIAPGGVKTLNYLKENITVIADGEEQKVTDMNGNVVTVNGKEQYKSLAESTPMFGTENDPPTFRIEGMEVFRNGNQLTALVGGAGFDNTQSIYVNGTECVGSSPSSCTKTYISKILWRISLPVPSDQRLYVAIVYGDEIVTSETTNTLALLRIDSAAVVSYASAHGRSPAILVIKIVGFGFHDRLAACIENVRARCRSIPPIIVKSSSEAYLKVENPDAAVVIKLTDTDTNFSARAIVAREPPGDK